MSDNEIRRILIERKKLERERQDWKDMAVITPVMMFVIIFGLWWGAM